MPSTLSSQQLPPSDMEIFPDPQPTNTFLACALSLLGLLFSPSLQERFRSCSPETSLSNPSLTPGWRSLISVCLDLRIVTKRKRFLTSFITRSKSLFKMLLSMISISLLKNLVFTQSYQLQFKIRYLNLCSKPLNRTSILFS
mgnify:CR=1 FL=1